MKKLCLFLTFVLTFLAGGDWARAQQQRPLVLRGGLLIDGTGKVPLRDPVVVIVGGKIRRVGPEGSVSVPADATVISMAGKTIIPGLVDSHMHLRNFLAPLFLYWGVTTVGDLGNPRGWSFAYRDAVAKGKVVGPYIMAVGNMLNAPRKPQDNLSTGELGGLGTFLNGNGYQTFVSDEASIRAAIAESKRLGADAVKLFLRMDPALMKTAAQIAHQQGLPVFSHFTSADPRVGLFLGTEEILDTGIDTHVHLFGLIKAAAPPEIRDRIARGEQVEAWHLLDTSKFPSLAQALVDRKMFLNPTLGGWVMFSRHRKEFERMATEFLNGPVGAVLPPESRRRYAAAYQPYRGERAEEMAEGYRKAGQFVKEFVQRGGKVIAGDDAGGARPAGVNLHVEMRMLEEVGLTPMQALQAATSWAMEAWGKSQEVGTIQPGKRADLVILNRNPLEDLTATRDIAEVIQGGKIVDRAALANWKDFLARPTPQQTPSTNTLIQLPFVHEMSPDALAANAQQIPELILKGENFTEQSQVLFNDRVLPAKFYSETRLGVTLRRDLLPTPGIYSLAVIRPGSGGGVSNSLYFIVTAD